MVDQSIPGSFGRVVGRLFPGQLHRVWREKGDEARDSCRWKEAVLLYRKYLAIRGDDAGIWVQLGNCSKEAGDFAGALSAYETALTLSKDDPDANLQLGHLYKVMNRPAKAIEAFRRSLESSPKKNPAMQELLGLGVSDGLHKDVPLQISPASRVIYIDVTDIIDYLKVNLSLSGIQRVVANLIEFAEDWASRDGDYAVLPVLPDYNGLAVYTIRMGLLKTLLLAVESRSSRSVIDGAIEAVKGSPTRVTPTSRDTLLIAGAFWIYQRYDLLNRLRQDGVRVAVFIHDLIQITNPEFVEPAATTVFRRSFADVMSVASYAMSNSRFVASDIDTYLRQRMNFHMPVRPVTLATELGTPRSNASLVSQDILEILGDDFVLCVGTIEIRKNHMYLIKIWEKLIDEGADFIPNLVFVGKWGWEIEELREHLKQSDYLGGRLIIFNGISDVELEVLYKNCLFTVYPSFAEGWGLPVGESLGYGKPCVASKATSIPEVGGDFCKYVDPFDWENGYGVIAGVLADRAALTAWTTRIENNFRPKSWQSFASELLNVVRQFGQDAALDAAGNNCTIESGSVVTFGNDALAHLDVRGEKLVTGRMTRISGWHALETWGCWASRRRAVLKFRSTLAPSSDIVIYLFLRTPDADISADCTIRCAAFSTYVDDLSPTPRWCTARGTVSNSGEIEIEIVSGRGFHHNHARELYVGLIAMGIAGSGDQAARAKIVEHIVPGGLATLAPPAFQPFAQTLEPAPAR